MKLLDSIKLINWIKLKACNAFEGANFSEFMSEFFFFRIRVRLIQLCLIGTFVSDLIQMLFLVTKLLLKANLFFFSA